jgi:putative transposase
VEAQAKVRKTFKYKLKPTPEQDRVLASVLWHCRVLYNVALEQRKTWWERGQGKSATYYQQKAELPALKAVCLQYAEVNAQVLQDALLRLDRTFQAFFRRVQTGEAPGYPRFQGRGRYNSFTYPQVGEHGGARRDNGFLVLSRVGRIAVRWSRPIEGTPKTVTINREADGCYACFSCAEAPAC